MLDPKKASELESGVNQGVSEPTESELTGEVGLDISQFPILVPDGNWEDVLSSFDFQSTPYFDTLGCNVFSGDHGVEGSLNALGYKKFVNPATGKNEISDRKVMKDMGMNGSQGSSHQQWINAVTAMGFVADAEWTFTDDMTKEQFFQEYPEYLKEKGKGFLDDYILVSRSIPTDVQSLNDALPYAPIKLFVGTGTGWNRGEPYIIPRTENPMGHAITLRKRITDRIPINDQYFPYRKSLALDYKIYFAFQTLLIPKKGNSMARVIKDPSGVVRVEFGSGANAVNLGINSQAFFQKIVDSGEPITELSAPTSSRQIGIIEEGLTIDAE